MKKIILISITLFSLLILIGFLFVGQTDNRVIFTLKNKIPTKLSSFIKETILFPFSHKDKIDILNEKNLRVELRISHLENQTQILRKTIFDLSSKNNDFELKTEKKLYQLIKMNFILVSFILIQCHGKTMGENHRVI
jgi:hypothetical protein